MHNNDEETIPNDLGHQLVDILYRIKLRCCSFKFDTGLSTFKQTFAKFNKRFKTDYGFDSSKWMNEFVLIFTLNSSLIKDSVKSKHFNPDLSNLENNLKYLYELNKEIQNGETNFYECNEKIENFLSHSIKLLVNWSSSNFNYLSKIINHYLFK